MHVDGYDPLVDNRFTLWPSDTTTNDACSVPDWVISGIGWDSEGHMYPLIDECHVLLSHNQVPHLITFRDGVGKLHRRRVVETYTLADDMNGEAWIRVAQFGVALPVTVVPLPISVPKSQTRLPGRQFVVGRGGAIGAVSDCFARLDAAICKSRSTVSFKGVIASPYDPNLLKAAALGFGDSGSPLISVVNDQWSLAGLAHSISWEENSNQIVTQFFVMAGAHLSDMKVCGANPVKMKMWEVSVQPAIGFDPITDPARLSPNFRRFR